MGHEVHMVTSLTIESEKTDWFETSEEGINIHWYPVRYQNKFDFYSRILAFLKFSLAASKKGMTLDGDIVFATSTPLTIIIPGYFVAKKLSIPLVFEVRDLWPELPIAIGALKNPIMKFVARALEKFAYKNSSKVIALSDGMRDGVLKSGYSSKDVSVIPNSCDLNFFKIDDEVKVRNDFRERNGIPLDAKVILYAGTFGKVNGVSYLVDLAFELRAEKDLFFLAVGHGAEFESVCHQAAERGVLDKNMRILASLPKDQMPVLFCTADFVTSLFIPLIEMEANSANKFFDGLSAGRCVLINYGGWQDELLLEYRAGMRLSRDVKIASDQLKHLCSLPMEIERYGNNARSLGEKLFCRDKLASELENVLKSAVKTHKS